MRLERIDVFVMRGRQRFRCVEEWTRYGGRWRCAMCCEGIVARRFLMTVGRMEKCPKCEAPVRMLRGGYHLGHLKFEAVKRIDKWRFEK